MYPLHDAGLEADFGENAKNTRAAVNFRPAETMTPCCPEQDGRSSTGRACPGLEPQARPETLRKGRISASHACIFRIDVRRMADPEAAIVLPHTVATRRSTTQYI
ncbi:hypothetical protein [Tabrizicola sp. M-4]|uniref:hypothetical protein n=1 Tax=Tabrizicola sp. M-4 TaxID=3055847 RepID=UPI003DA9FAFD